MATCATFIIAVPLVKRHLCGVVFNHDYSEGVPQVFPCRISLCVTFGSPGLWTNALETLWRFPEPKFLSTISLVGTHGSDFSLPSTVRTWLQPEIVLAGKPVVLDPRSHDSGHTI